MIAVDTNVLVYAHRREMPHHDRGLAALTELAEGSLPWAMPVFVLNEFLRVVTHRRVFPAPSSLADALGVIRALLASPTARVLYPGHRYFELLSRTLEQADGKADLVLDAAIVAVCKEHGVDDLLTADRDFHRFSDLRVLPL
ncbi:MAG: TA system VapC family ribonuclease toxin [Actinomycetota bacterium]